MVDAVSAGIVLVLAGMGIVILALLSQSKGEGKVKGGAIIMVGPIPIIFGSDARWASIAILLAILLIALVLVLGVA